LNTLNQGRKVCIVTPRHLSANPRVVKEAAALSAAGFAVTIVCGDYILNAKEKDQRLTDPKWKVHHVTFGRHVASRSIHLRQKLCQKLSRSLNRIMPVKSGLAAISQSPIAWDLKKVARSVQADLYIAHYVAALPAAAKAAKLYGARYAFDAEDFHLGDLPDLPQHDFERSLIRAIEGKWLPGASYVTAAAPLIADAYAETYGIERPTVILNVFPRSSGPSQPTPKGTAVPGPSLYWFSQTIGAGRGLETALEAISIAKSKPHLHLRGTPATGYREKLMDLAASLNVAERLHFHDPISPNELERAGAAFDIGFVGETGETRNRRIALTNKLFSYLTSGLPIVASGILAHSDIARSLDGAASLFDIGDSRRLASELDAILDNEVALGKARKHSWSLGQTAFCWETEAPKVVARIRQACLVDRI
jgi:glycosyltransferase involved in cell wall biosynthesis